MNTNKNINGDLKEVIERNVDAFKGYQKASEKVKNEHLVSSFRQQANQRRQFAVSLQSQTDVLGHEGENRIENGSFAGNLHRTWMDSKPGLCNRKRHESIKRKETGRYVNES